LPAAEQWPRRPPSTAEKIRYLINQHGLTRSDLVPILGTPSRVSEVLRGKKGLSMAMVQRLRARFRVPADLLLSPWSPWRRPLALGPAGQDEGEGAGEEHFEQTDRTATSVPISTSPGEMKVPSPQWSSL
jgi:transcriptional regulator with XRE-family HTH domain